MGEFSKKITTKNADGGLSETFTNSAEQGVISQLDYFDHDITNDANISGYYVVQPDNFVYNPRVSVTAPCGPINRNRLNRAGVMSPLYTVFSVDESVDKTYLEHYFKTSRWHDFMFLEGNSGARSDRFSISDATFFEMPIWCPKILEQRAIAKQLETTDSLITLHQRKRQYRGLYGYLSWEQRKFSELYVVNNERNESCEFDYDKTLSVATMTYNGGNGAAENSLSTYKVVRVGDIAFEGHANKEHAYGRFVLNDAGDGLMSPRFSCLRPTVEQRYSFWKYYIPRESTMRSVLVNATKSGTMMNELVPADLMRESILVPVLCEQETIGCFFKQLDSLITLHQ